MKTSHPHTFSKLLFRHTEGHLSVSVFLTDHGDRVYHDVVLYKRIRQKDGSVSWKRGHNLKPNDLPVVVGLIEEARAWLDEYLEREPMKLPDLSSKHREEEDSGGQEDEDLVV